MDTLQLTFKESYVRTLRSNIKVENYLGSEFPYDHNMVRRVAGVIQPKDLDKKLDPNDNYKSAIALFEAYQNISLLVASSEPFWVYLAHVDLFNYVQQRWNGLTKAENKIKYIQDHWFYAASPMRTTLMDMWWSVYCTIDRDRPQGKEYELTKIFFENETFRTRVFGTSAIFRHREAAIGVLEYIESNTNIKKRFEENGRLIASYFNQLGATKQLAYLDREYFRKEMEKIKFL